MLSLFPLSSVLFPAARMSLQIFEPRYLDLVKTSLKNDELFGIIGIENGAEVISPTKPSPDIYSIGTTARIKDWASLEHGRLGITIEGLGCFKVLATDVQPDFLMRAETEPVMSHSDSVLPEHYAGMAGLLKQLACHPSVKALGCQFDYLSTLSVANNLAQLLPLAANEKQELLEIGDSVQRLQRITELTDNLSGASN